MPRIGEDRRNHQGEAAKTAFVERYGCSPHQRPDLIREWLALLNHYRAEILQNYTAAAGRAGRRGGGRPSKAKQEEVGV